MTSILWLGAHKTGTTFLQKCLDLSQPALQEHSVLYMELEEFRDKYTRPLLNEDAPGQPAPNEFDAEVRTKLVFDENIPGLVQHALNVRGFYPDMVPRAAKITEHLRLRVDEIVFGVRSYDSYLPSLYCETLKSTPFRTFEDYLAHSFKARPLRRDRPAARVPEGVSANFDRMNWYRLVRRLVEAYPDARVRVYFHEQLRGNEAQLISEVIGIPASEVSLLGTSERVGFSGKAVERLHAINAQRKVERADVRRVVRRYPSGPEFPSYYPWEHADREVLRANYRADSEQLRSDPAVEVIELG